MGNYALYTDLEARHQSVVETSYFTGDEATGTPTQSKLDECITGAEGVLDSRIGAVYATPVSVGSNATLTAMLKRYTLDIADYYLWDRVRNAPDTIKQLYDDALAWADKIADGTYVLPGSPTPASTDARGTTAMWTGSNRTLTSTSPRIFTRETMDML